MAGVDRRSKKPELYWIDFYSNMQEMNFAAHGHAAYFVMSTMDAYWHDSMTEQEAMALLKKCLDELAVRYIGNFKQFFVKKVSLKGVETLNL